MKKNVAIIFAANALTLVSGLLTGLLAAWALGPEGRGDLAVAVLYPNIVALVAGLGLPHATRFFIAREPRKLSMLFSNALLYAGVVGIIALLIAEIVIPNVIGNRSEAVIWLVKAYLINIPFALVYDLMSAMLEGARRFKWAAVSKILFFVIQSGAYLALWATGHLTVFTAVATMVVAQLANTSTALLCVIFVLKPRWRLSLRAFKKTLRFGVKYYIGVVTSFTTLRLDQMMLAGMATSIEMGLYVIAVRLSEVMTVLASSVSDVLMPEVASSKGAERSIRALTRSLRQTMFVYLIFLLPLIALSPLILRFSFGSNFAAATPALRILLVGSMVWSAASIINSGLNGLGYPGLTTISRLSSAVVTVLTLIVWLPRYGILGAALSSLAGYSMMLTIALFWLMRKEKLRISEIFRPRQGDFPMKDLTSLLRPSVDVQNLALATTESEFVEQLFQRQASETPDQIAVISKTGQIGYAELNRKANQLAWFLKSRGVGPEMLIPISVDRSAHMAIGILGILKAGAAFVPIDPNYPQERIDFMVANTQAPFILTQDGLLTSCGIERVCLDDDLLKISEYPDEDPPLTATAANLAYVIYTSGSTGEPKGVMLTRANLGHYVHALQSEFRLTADDSYLHLASMGFSSSRRHLLLPLAFGATVVIADEDQRMDPLPLFEMIKTQRITVFDAVPSFQRHCLTDLLDMKPLLRAELLDNDLRLIISASEPLYSDIPNTWMSEFRHPAEHIHMIGQTETSGIVALGRLTKADVIGEVRAVPVGVPIANTDIVLLDDDLMPVDDGERGEMYVSGAGVGRGYLGRPDLTTEKFVELSINGAPKALYCRTGDHARRKPDGRLECLGRSDYQIKIRGNRVELSEIEALFLGHSTVRECVVVGREDKPGDIRLSAYIVTATQEKLVADELRGLAETTLPDYMRPAAFVFLDELPLTVNGKVDRKALPFPENDLQNSPSVNHDRDAPLSTKIEAIWCEILGVAAVAADDSFFALGGHSLMAARMISRVRALLGVQLPIRTIFDEPTLIGFCRILESDEILGSEVSRRVFPERPDRIPLSFAQQRVWFLGELDQGLTAYNECEILKLNGELDPNALEAALNRIISRHEILRTSFRTENGEPYQVIFDEADVDLDFIDLAGHATSQDAAMDVARELAEKPFDLSKSPLFRTTLAKTAENEHFLILVLHHTVSDQWTVGILIKELDAFYSAETTGRLLGLPPLPIQYADYSSWQQNWLTTDDYQAQLGYWREQLDGAPSLLELPTDKPRPAVQRYKGSQATAFLNGDSGDMIQEFCKTEGVTVFMLLLATWELLLYRYSGQDQVVVGTPIAGRTCPETEDLIGFFVNTLAMRGDLSGDPTFREFLQRTRERALGAFANQDLPLEKLVEEVNPERNMSYTPLFQVMFTLQNTPGFGEMVGSLAVERRRLRKQSAKFDLSLDVFERPNGYELQLEFNTDLFLKETADRILSHLTTLIRSLLDDPSQRVNDAKLLSDAELTQILDVWNSATVVVPPVCVHALIEEQAVKRPQAIAVVWNDQSITYGELDQKANQLARYLLETGVKPDQIVGVHLTKSIEMIIAVVAVMKAGGAYLPMDPNYPAERLQFMVSEAGVKVLITQEAFRSSAAELNCNTVIYTDTDSDDISAESVERPSSSVKPENLIYVTFTSGSTGRAKGVMIEHRNVANAVAAWEKEYHLSSLASHLQMASFSFDVFTGDLTRALCSGATLVLCPAESLLDPSQLETLIRNHNIESAEFVPAVIRPLMDHLEATGRILESLKLVVVGSDTWQSDEYRRLQRVCGKHTRVVNSYGITEATIDSTFFDMPDDEEASAEIVPIGRPFSNTQIYILDTFGNPVPVGIPGELYQGGNALARGYLNRPDLTAEKFVEIELPFPGGASKKRLYRSGDLARYRNDGTIAIIGRADNQIKLRGYRIELGEIESVISRHPDVNECVVTLREDVPSDKRLVAYFTIRSGELKTAELRNFIKSALPEYMVPSAYVLVSEWKLTPNGKIDRKQLPRPAVNAPFSANEYTPPRTEVEKLLADIWGHLLRVDRVGVDDNFFELGGHSLLATQAISRTRDALGCDLPLRVMFETPTIGEIAERLKDQVGNAELSEPLTSKLNDGAEIERLLAELEGVSEEEAYRFLADLDKEYSPTYVGSK
ncbi:hypothetical protein BH10ACI2_BH10ACI2_07020 [soil metagenome]